MSDITRKNIDDIVWSDIELLISNQIEEGQFIEFKSGLLFDRPNKKDAASDKSCKALVAFANAYGGTLILGIDDKNDFAKNVNHFIDDLRNRTERLARSIRDLIAPPLPGLKIRALEKENDKGVIIMRVPASSAAPHGFGKPAEAYKREGKNSRPMTMPDLQSLFWDARSRRERVEAIRKEQSDLLVRMQERSQVRPNHVSPANYVPTPKIGFRFTAIPQIAIQLSEMPIENFRNNFRPGYFNLGINGAPFGGQGDFGSRLRPMAHGLCEDTDGHRWTISDKGVISFVGFYQGRSNHSNWYHVPSWYACVTGLALVMADRLRVAAGEPDAHIEVDCEFLTYGDIRIVWDDHYLDRPNPDFKPAPDQQAFIGPFLFGGRDTTQAVFASLEKEIWAFFGMHPRSTMKPTWDKVWAPPQY